MQQSETIFLVGPMGAGKSAVGKQLARLLHYEFADSDSFVEERTGVDVAYIFEREGEEGFRKRESAAIDELSQRRRIVVATGGGAVLSPDNRSRMASRGTVIYLETSVREQLRRTKRSTHRPLLYTDDPKAALQSLLDVRDPLYREIADIVFSTDGQKVATVARALLDRLSAG